MREQGPRRDTSWDAGPVGQVAVGPGRSRVSRADRPRLRLVPEPSPARDSSPSGAGGEITGRARTDAVPRAAEVPRQAGYGIVLCTGEVLTATPAVGDEIIELDSLLRTCLAELPEGEDTGGDLDWTAADLRAVLVPPGGGCLVVRTSDGAMIGLGSAPPADELDPTADSEPVLLVHPLFRGHRLGRWMCHTLADHLEV